MKASPPRVIVCGETRWAPILDEELRLKGIRSTHYQPMRSLLKHLSLGRLLHQLRANIYHVLFVRCGHEPTSLMKRSRQTGARLVAHWIGSDVIALRKYTEENGHIPPPLKEYATAHLADSPQLKKELGSLGIESEVVRLLPRKIEADVQPLPELPAVLSYWSDRDPEFYSANLLMDLARENPSVPFYIVGTSGQGLAGTPENVAFLGEVADIEPVYVNASILIRMPRHDSLSAMVLEMLARGRYCIYSEVFPHTLTARTLDEARGSLSRLLVKREPNLEGAAYVRQNFSWQREIEKLKDIYARILQQA